MSGQIADIGNFGLIDKDTPAEAYTKASYIDGSTWELVFSDEFNVDDRTFYPGDDPYWEAVDLHYWGTNNMEWCVFLYYVDKFMTNALRLIGQV